MSLVMPTRIVIVGSGGREHALAWKLAADPGVNEVVVAPGSAGIAEEPRVSGIPGVAGSSIGAIVDLARATPIYDDFPGWSEPIHAIRSLADLPENARRYVSAIEEHAGVPIVLVSVGPERTQTIERAWRPMRKRVGLPA